MFPGEGRGAGSLESHSPDTVRVLKPLAPTTSTAQRRSRPCVCHSPGEGKALHSGVSVPNRRSRGYGFQRERPRTSFPYPPRVVLHYLNAVSVKVRQGLFHEHRRVGFCSFPSAVPLLKGSNRPRRKPGDAPARALPVFYGFPLRPSREHPICTPQAWEAQLPGIYSAPSERNRGPRGTGLLSLFLQIHL